MSCDVIITGVGIISPTGIGVDQVWQNLDARRSGVVPIPSLAEAGWIAAFGGVVDNFEPKEHVKPRKSLKVMSRETQFAFAAGEMAWENACFDGCEVDPERVGVISAAGLQYCPVDELTDPMSASLGEKGEVDLVRWGESGMGRMFPLWMLKYLPNMAACHVGIRRDARGPTNTISHGDTSSLVALGEATETIRRGAADVMLIGGTSSCLDLTHLLWGGTNNLSMRTDDPAAACRPFEADRDGKVNAEGAAFFVLESREHAERRGFGTRGEAKDAHAWGEVTKVVTRSEPIIKNGFQGISIEQAIADILKENQLSASDLAMVKAHGSSQTKQDQIEAAALAKVIGDTPVTAPTSYTGSSGSGSGAIELALSLIAWREGVVPATLNYETPDKECPLNLSKEHRQASGDAILALNYAKSGQSTAAILKRA